MWVYDMSIFMLGYCGLLSGGYVLKHKAHINVDIIYARLSPRWKAILDVLSGLVIFFMVILVIIYGWEAAMESIASHEATGTEWGPPVGHLKLMAAVGGFLLLIQAIANWIRSLYHAITDRELDE